MIESFHGRYRWLSNFYPATVNFAGVQFPSVENAYQAAKCRRISDIYTFQNVSPADAKRMGRKIEISHNWNDSWKRGVMQELLFRKFKGHADLRAKILATGDEELQEGNTWGDTFWGVYNGIGYNYLGKTLMMVRHVIRENEKNNPQLNVLNANGGIAAP